MCAPQLVDILAAVYSENRWVYEWVREQPEHSFRRGRQPVVVGIIDNRKTVVKRLFHGGILSPLTRDRFLSVTRLINAYKVSGFLRNNGVLTPETIFVTWRRSGPFYRCEMGVDYLDNSLDASDYLFSRTSKPTPERVSSVARGIGELVARMHRLEFLHPDLNLMNFLVENNQNIHIIDLDKASVPDKPLSSGQKQANISRLIRSVRKQGQSASSNQVDTITELVLSAYHGAIS